MPNDNDGAPVDLIQPVTVWIVLLLFRKTRAMIFEDPESGVPIAFTSLTTANHAGRYLLTRVASVVAFEVVTVEARPEMPTLDDLIAQRGPLDAAAAAADDFEREEAGHAALVRDVAAVFPKIVDRLGIPQRQADWTEEELEAFVRLCDRFVEEP